MLEKKRLCGHPRGWYHQRWVEQVIQIMAQLVLRPVLGKRRTRL